MEPKIIDLLQEYFKPLNDYRIGDSEYDNKTGLLNQPLWFYRLNYMRTKNILGLLNEQIKNTDSNQNAVELFLAELVLQSQDISQTLDKIKIDRLITYSESVDAYLTNFALSLQITFYLRDIDPVKRKKAWDFLKTGHWKNTTRNLNDFILLSGAKLSSLKIEDINLSGHCLFGLVAESATIDVGNFRFCCLEKSSFYRANMSKCNFEYSHIFEANLQSLICKESHFEDSIFEMSDFSTSKFENCFFANADFERVNLNGCNLKNSDFKNAFNLTLEQIKFTNCLENSTGMLNNIDLVLIDKFKDQLEKKGLDLTKNVNIINNYKEIFDNEKDKTSTDRSANWPLSNKFNHDPKWNDPNDVTQKVAHLEKNSQIFRFISDYIHLTSDNISYKSICLEMARLNKAINDKELLKILKNETPHLLPHLANTHLLPHITSLRIPPLLPTPGPPSHVGIAESITIKYIMVVHNPKLWKIYQDEKNKFISLYQKIQYKNLIKWHCVDDPATNSIVNKFEPFVEQKIGECWLFHGTSQSVVKSIIQNGFTTKFAVNKFVTGYGALGKGAYFSDSFAKIAQYISCPKCNKNQCTCEVNSLNDCKTAIMSRVLLGRIFEDPYKKEVHSELPPKGFNSRYGPCKKLGFPKGFGSNEFCVPGDEKEELSKYLVRQAYPEYLIFYTENNLKSNAHSNKSHITWIENWQELKSNFIKNKELNKLEKSIRDYDNILRVDGENTQKRLEYLEGRFEVVLSEFIQSESSPFRVTLEEKWKIEKKCLHDLLYETSMIMNANRTYKLELKVNSYIYNYTNAESESFKWTKAIKYLNELIRLDSSNFYYYILRAHANFHLQEWSLYIVDNLKAIHLDKQECLKHSIYDEERFFKVSLTYLLMNKEFDSTFQMYYENWLNSIADWLAQKLSKRQINFETWQYFYWSLETSEQMKVFADAITDASLKTRLSDAYGVKYLTSIFLTEFETKLNSLISNELTNVEISWLEEDSSIKKGHLETHFINQLFNSESGYPLLDKKESRGNSLVISLKQSPESSEYFMFVKFYPEYPLRQELVDQLCYRLSGYGAYTKLAKLVHTKKPHIAYPVLISKALGQYNLNERKLTVADYSKEEILPIEENLNLYSFTWKFIETYLIQPRDDKPDNVSVNKISDYKEDFIYISLDSNITFGYKYREIAKQPNAYSIIYLSNAMKKTCHSAVLSAITKLKFDEVLISLLIKLRDKYKNLIQPNDVRNGNKYLFTYKEADFIKNNLIEQEKRILSYVMSFFSKNPNKKYSVTCHLDACLVNTDLNMFYDRFEKLKNVANYFATKNKYSLTACFDEMLDKFINSNTISHFELLAELDDIDSEIYSTAFDKGTTLSERFKHLSAIKENFELVPSISGNSDLKTKKPTPPGSKEMLLGTFKQYQLTNRIKDLNKINENIEDLQQHIDLKSFLVKSNNDFKQLDNLKINESLFTMQHVFDNIDWSAAGNEKAKCLIDQICNSKEIKQLCFNKCDLLNEDYLGTIFTNNYKTLVGLSLRECKYLTDFKILNFRVFPEKFQLLFLSRLTFKTIECSYLINLSCLYLYKLEEIESIKITNKSKKYRLKEVFIEYCPKLKSICIDISSLKQMILENLSSLEKIVFNYFDLMYDFEKEFSRINEDDYEKEYFEILFKNQTIQKKKIIMYIEYMTLKKPTRN